MEYTKILTILTALATIAVGVITVLTYVEDTDIIENNLQYGQKTPVQTPIVILAKTTFNDSGYTYIIDFNGNILKMNNSISVISVVKGSD